MDSNYETQTNLDLSVLDKLNFGFSQNFNFETLTKLTTLKIPYYSLYNEKLIKLTNLTELHVTPHNGTNFETLELRETRGIYGLTKLTNLLKLTIEYNNYFENFDIFNKNLEMVIITLPSCNLSNYKSCTGLDNL